RGAIIVLINSHPTIGKGEISWRSVTKRASYTNNFDESDGVQLCACAIVIATGVVVPAAERPATATISWWEVAADLNARVHNLKVRQHDYIDRAIRAVTPRHRPFHHIGIGNIHWR